MGPLRAFVRNLRDFGLIFALKAGGATGECDAPGPGGRTLRIRLDDSDLSTLRQVFIQRDYDLDKFPQGRNVQRRYEAVLAAGQTPVIVDAGANIGAASVWFSHRFPKAHVVAVEPDPANAALCRQNTSGLNVTVMEAAIGATPGRVQLSNPEDKSWAVRTERAEAGGVEIVTIAQAKAAGGSGPLLLAKIDIEGFESDLFAEGLAWLDEADVVYIELHDWMLPGQGSSRTTRQALMHRDGDFLLAGENLIFVSDRVLASPGGAV